MTDEREHWSDFGIPVPGGVGIEPQGRAKTEYPFFWGRVVEAVRYRETGYCTPNPLFEAQHYSGINWMSLPIELLTKEEAIEALRLIGEERRDRASFLRSKHD